MRRVLSLACFVLLASGPAAVVRGEQVPAVPPSLAPDIRLQPPPPIPDTVGEVVRNLVSQKKLLNIPVKGKLKHSIDKGAPTFDMAGGPSSVVLFALPEYQAPYSLTIKSSRRGIGRTTEIFIPSGLMFDAQFQQLAAFGEEHIASTTEAVVIALTVSEQRRDARYLLLYTRGDLVGERVDMRASYFGVAVAGQVGTFLGNSLGMARLERSLEAKLEVERKGGFRPVNQDATNHLAAKLEVEPNGGFRPVNQDATNRLAGMTREEVSAQFGPPSLVEDAAWYYDSPKGTLRIHFKDNVVSEAQPGNFDLSAIKSPAAPPQAVARTGDPRVTPPSLVKEVKPEYSPEARRALIQGSVFLECVVQVSGACSDIRVVRSLDAEHGLDVEAVKAARQWRFEPATKDGKPVPMFVTIEMSFALKK